MRDTYESWRPTNTATSATSVTMTTTCVLPAVERTWTWREAVEIASRVTGSKVTVRKEGDRWVVRYSFRPIAVNYS